MEAVGEMQEDERHGYLLRSLQGQSQSESEERGEKRGERREKISRWSALFQVQDRGRVLRLANAGRRSFSISLLHSARIFGK